MGILQDFDMHIIVDFVADGVGSARGKLGGSSSGGGTFRLFQFEDLDVGNDSGRPLLRSNDSQRVQ